MTDPVSEFLVSATIPLDRGHASGTLDAARAILHAHPEVAGASIHTAAVLGDDVLVRGYLAHDASLSTATGGPHGWDALTHLCFSRFLQHDTARSAGFVRAAQSLLDGGASANGGFMTPFGHAGPEWESVLYGAAGVAHHAALTALLLSHGANANDGEVTYHVPDSYDNAALRVLVEHGTLSADSLATLLLRKADWHDVDGIAYLLANGADPHRKTHWDRTGLEQAIVRDNDIAIVQRMLDAVPLTDRPEAAERAAALAARDGRRDVLELLGEHGHPIHIEGADALLAYCALNATRKAQLHAARHPDHVQQVATHGGRTMGEFAGIGNSAGIRRLLDLGVPVDATDEEGNGYWGIAPGSTALHVAAWRLRLTTVKTLLAAGANPNLRDAEGRTPLMLSVQACVHSHWQELRTPNVAKALLAAGARLEGVSLPTGYAAVDRVLQTHAS